VGGKQNGEVGKSGKLESTGIRKKSGVREKEFLGVASDQWKKTCIKFEKGEKRESATRETQEKQSLTTALRKGMATFLSHPPGTGVNSSTGGGGGLYSRGENNCQQHRTSTDRPVTSAVDGSSQACRLTAERGKGGRGRWKKVREERRKRARRSTVPGRSCNKTPTSILRSRV